jgi:hypothetical protein
LRVLGFRAQGLGFRVQGSIHWFLRGRGLVYRKKPRTPRRWDLSRPAAPDGATLGPAPPCVPHMHIGAPQRSRGPKHHSRPCPRHSRSDTPPWRPRETVDYDCADSFAPSSCFRASGFRFGIRGMGPPTCTTMMEAVGRPVVAGGSEPTSERPQTIERQLFFWQKQTKEKRIDLMRYIGDFLEVGYTRASALPARSCHF